MYNVYIIHSNINEILIFEENLRCGIRHACFHGGFISTVRM